MELDSALGAAAFPPMQERGGSRSRAGGRLVVVRSEHPQRRPRGDCFVAEGVASASAAGLSESAALSALDIRLAELAGVPA
jgi:hypothetical protein